MIVLSTSILFVLNIGILVYISLRSYRFYLKCLDNYKDTLSDKITQTDLESANTKTFLKPKIGNGLVQAN